MVAVPEDALSEMLGAGVTVPHAMLREDSPGGRLIDDVVLSLSRTIVSVLQLLVSAYR